MIWRMRFDIQTFFFYAVYILFCLKWLFFQDAALLDYLMNVCQVIVDTVDFSSLAPKQTFGLGLSPSPSKWTRRRQKPMGNIHSFVCLVATLMEAVCASAINSREELPFTNQVKLMNCKTFKPFIKMFIIYQKDYYIIISFLIK